MTEAGQEQRENQLRQMLRAEQGLPEKSMVTSPGARDSVCVVQVVGHVTYNKYVVQPVYVPAVGSPYAISEVVEAVNIAEDFLGSGQLSAGCYAIMHRIGESNVFCLAVQA